LSLNIPRRWLFEDIPPLMGINCLVSRSGDDFTALIHSAKIKDPVTHPVSNRVTLTVTADAIQEALTSCGFGDLLDLSKVSHLTVNYKYPYPCEPKPQGTIASTVLLYNEEQGRFAHSRNFGRFPAHLLTPEGIFPFTAELQAEWFFNPKNRAIASLHDQASRNEALTLDCETIGSHYPEYKVAKD
jgi:hypothetical protein